MKKITRFLVGGLLVAAMIFAPASNLFVLPTTISAEAATLSLNKKSVSIGVGETCTLTVKGSTNKVVWSSKNKSIATVSGKGEVKGVKIGSTTIYAKIGGKKLKCKVTVKKSPKATSIAVSSSLKPVDTLLDGDGNSTDLYTVDINDFSKNWINNNFKVTTTPANCSYTVRYADRTAENVRFSTTVPTRGGYYMVIFTSGSQSCYIYLDIVEDVNIYVSTDLEPIGSEEIDGDEYDVYEVASSQFSSDWIGKNFTVTTDPQDCPYEIAYADRTASEVEYIADAPKAPGSYMVRFSVDQGESSDEVYIWLDIVE